MDKIKQSVQDTEAWRDKVEADRRGSWRMVRATIEANGWYAHIWKDVKLDDKELIQVWSLPPLIGLIMRASGERVGLLYGEIPDFAKEKKRGRNPT